MERRVAVAGSGKVAQRSLDWCAFWIRFLLHSTNWRWIYCGTMDQRPTLRIARPRGRKRAEIQGCFGVIFPRGITGRLQEVDRPRQIYVNGLHNEESLSFSSFQHVIAFYTSATETLWDEIMHSTFGLSVFSNPVFRSELLVLEHMVWMSSVWQSYTPGT